MRRLVVVAVLALACVSCRGEATQDGLDDIESTLTSIEADINQP